MMQICLNVSKTLTDEQIKSFTACEEVEITGVVEAMGHDKFISDALEKAEKYDALIEGGVITDEDDN